MNMAKLSFTEVVLLLLLVLALILSAEARENTPKTLRRMKREWILPPTKLWENIDYTGKDFIAKIRSDWDTTSEVQYSLSGPGADLPPINLFMVDPDTGFLTITGVLDREKYPSYNLTGIAKFKDGTRAEEEIPLTITVLDQNDNPPRFERHSGNVKEASKAETFVMQIVAKDDDQAGTINSEISYSIISQEPAGDGHMFTIDRKTGKIHVKEATLDRETHDFYTLIVKGIDLGGAAGGLTATGTVEIKILDINDNRPILEKSEYSGSVDENVADVVVMRIKALDKDLRNTDNWLTVFSIASGNEDNLFSIETDKETNEGILKLIKPVDFEDLKKLELGLLIENVSPFVEGGAVLMNVGVNVGEGGPIATGAAAGVAAGVAAGAGAGGGGGLDLGVEIGVDADLEGGVNLGLDAGLKPGVGPGSGVGLEPGFQPGQGTKPKPNSQTNYLIKIAVNNMPESPAFMPDTKSVPVSENPNQTPDDGAITVFTATDPDTGKPAEDVSYAKAYDPDNWFTINEKTAEIKLNKAPDRESPFLVNGTYIAKILAITKDMPSKTATGTIAIQVNDYNDHCPTLTTSHSSLCSNEKTISVTGFDKDASPNAAPFTFRIIAEGTRGNWDVEVINATSAALHSRDLLWPGTYKLQVEVLDAQGLSCQSKDIFNLDVCICEETEDCTMAASRLRAPSTGLSASAISVMLMAFCLLLFIPLILLFCRCRGDKTIFPDQFKDLPFGTKEHLIPYHTEGRGEDKEVPRPSVPFMLENQKKLGAAKAASSNAISSKILQSHQMAKYDEAVQRIWETNRSRMETDNADGFSKESFNHGNGSASFSRQTSGAQHTTTLYEDIALPEAFLRDYYSQKAAYAVQGKDSVWEYHFEGSDSSAGSVGCCSLLGSDNDLHFLNDLSPKFKTLSEICSPPTQTPKSSLTQKIQGPVQTNVVDIAKAVDEPKIDCIVETQRMDIKTLAHSNVTNSISYSSNIDNSATLPRQAQTVILQQWPVYYTTAPLLQPLQYAIQPQLQSSVLLDEGAHGAKFPGLHVVSGPQDPYFGVVISSIESPTSPVSSPVSPTLLLPCGPGLSQDSVPEVSFANPASPTLFLPDGPKVSQNSVPADGWNVVGSNSDGSYILVEHQGSPGKAKGADPGTSQGTLPRGANLVREAALPQGVLHSAAQGSVYGLLPEHTIAKKRCRVAVNRNVGQTWVGETELMDLGWVTVLEVGQPRMGMEYMVAVKTDVRKSVVWSTGINPVGIREVIVNQLHGVLPIEQTLNASGSKGECTIASPKKVKITIAFESAKTHQRSKEEFMINPFQYEAIQFRTFIRIQFKKSKTWSPPLQNTVQHYLMRSLVTWSKLHLQTMGV